MPDYSRILEALMAVPGQIGLGIPQGDIKNAQGDVIYPTNMLERLLQGSAAPTNQFAAAFIGPGARGMPIPQARNYFENLVSDYAKGNLTARQVQERAAGSGWNLNLRGRGSEIEAFDPNGRQHWLQP